MRTLGIGVVGYGFIGKIHTLGYRNLAFYFDPPPAAIRLVGVATSSAATAEKARAHGGFEFGTADWRDLVARPDIDVINVCSPNKNHPEVVIAALAAGKHVYCDKPLARTLTEAKAIAAAAAHASTRHQMTFQYRFLPATLRAKQLIDEGFLGRIYHFRGAYLHSGYVDPRRPFSWRMSKAESGGGALYDLGAHILDLLRHLVGDFAAVRANLTTAIPQRPAAGEPDRLVDVDVDDLAHIELRAASGAVGTVEASRLATGVNDELRFEIHGEKGALAFNLMDPNWLWAYDNRRADMPYGGDKGFTKIECVQRFPKPVALPGPKFSLGWERAHLECLRQFLDCVAADRAACPSLLDGCAVQALLEASQISSAENRWVEVNGL